MARLYSGELNRLVIAALLFMGGAPSQALSDIWNNDPGAGQLPPGI